MGMSPPGISGMCDNFMYFGACSHAAEHPALTITVSGEVVGLPSSLYRLLAMDSIGTATASGSEIQI